MYVCLGIFGLYSPGSNSVCEELTREQVEFKKGWSHKLSGPAFFVNTSLSDLKMAIHPLHSSWREQRVSVPVPVPVVGGPPLRDTPPPPAISARAARFGPRVYVGLWPTHPVSRAQRVPVPEPVSARSAVPVYT